MRSSEVRNLKLFEMRKKTSLERFPNYPNSPLCNAVTYSKEGHEKYKVASDEVKEEVYKNLAINIGNPEDMVTGKAFVKLSSDSSRASFV